MKVLFVCKYNLGRSRMADFFFNNLTKNHSAESAGVYTYSYQKKFKGKVPKASEVAKVMKEIGIDITKKKIKQINKKIVESSDKVIAIMSEKRAKLDLPDYISKNKNFRLWKIEDTNGTLTPKKQYESYKRTRDEIKRRIKELIKEIERR